MFKYHKIRFIIPPSFNTYIVPQSASSTIQKNPKISKNCQSNPNLWTALGSSMSTISHLTVLPINCSSCQCIFKFLAQFATRWGQSMIQWNSEKYFRISLTRNCCRIYKQKVKLWQCHLQAYIFICCLNMCKGPRSSAEAGFPVS